METRRNHLVLSIMTLVTLPTATAPAPLRIILFGPPGVGKGTQSRAIVKRYGVCHISTGDLLRREVAAASRIGRRVKSLMASGELVPNGLVVRLVLQTIRSTRACQRRGWLLDGFPRTAAQAHALLDEGLVPHHIIVLNATNATIIARALERARTAIAHGQTPRKDDNAQTMGRRIAEYERNRDATLAAMRQYLRVASLDGGGTPAAVGDAIERAVDYSGPSKHTVLEAMSTARV